LHVSHTRLVIEETEVLGRVRLFRDDATKAFRRPFRRDADTDRAVLAYLDDHLQLRADGARAKPTMLDAGTEKDDSGVESWWVLLSFGVAHAPRTIGITNTLLFDIYGDQQNLVAILRNPGGQRSSLYFQPGDRTEQVVRF
jgi:hypothetical protein